MGGARHGRPVRAFVLLEVILTLMILGIAVLAFMRSFTQSLDAAKRMEVQTQAQFFAEQLLGEFEIHPPEEGLTVGGFGEAYAPYTFRVRMEIEPPDYGNLEGDDQVDRFFAMRNYHLDILYDDGAHTPFRAISLDSSVIGYEKFTYDSKRSYGDY